MFNCSVIIRADYRSIEYDVIWESILKYSLIIHKQVCIYSWSKTWREFIKQDMWDLLVKIFIGNCKNNPYRIICLAFTSTRALNYIRHILVYYYIVIVLIYHRVKNTQPEFKWDFYQNYLGRIMLIIFNLNFQKIFISLYYLEKQLFFNMSV